MPLRFGMVYPWVLLRRVIKVLEANGKIKAGKEIETLVQEIHGKVIDYRVLPDDQKSYQRL